MPINAKSQEALSEAYLMSIASVGNVTVNPFKHDEYGTDTILQKRVTLPDGRECDVNLNVQLKSTSSHNEYRIDGSDIKYTLKVANYRALTMQSTYPKCLILLLLPDNQTEWVEQSVDELILKKCMYWVSLDGLGETKNEETVTISIPLDHYLDSSALGLIMQKCGEHKPL
jgi:hypothetical protein